MDFNLHRDPMVSFLVKKVKSVLKSLKGKKLCVLGLSFKPETDDLREAPSLDIIKELKKLGAKVFAYDPVAESKARPKLPGVSFADDIYMMLKNADGMIVAAEWNEFKALDLKKIKKQMRNPVIFDGYSGTPGSWGGFLLEGYFRINGLIIKNAGEFLLPGATEKANIVSKYNLSNYQNQYLTNSEISNSAGWGIVVEPNTYNFEFDKPENNNTFNNNALGDIIVL